MRAEMEDDTGTPLPGPGPARLPASLIYWAGVKSRVTGAELESSRIKEVDDGIWLVSFMEYDLGYIDLEEKTLQPLENPFGPKV